LSIKAARERRGLFARSSPAIAGSAESAESVKSKRKQTKIKVSKIAFFYFLLLTFIFSKRDFSMRYSRVKQKYLFPL